MSLDQPNPLAQSAKGLHFGILCARFNARLVEVMAQRCTNAIESAGGTVSQRQVPGSNELPFAASRWLKVQRFDAIIVLGVIIRGETAHHDVIAHSTATALHQLAIDAGVPIINGIVVAENQPQAEARAIGAYDRGTEFGHSALEMAVFNRNAIG